MSTKSDQSAKVSTDTELTDQALDGVTGGSAGSAGIVGTLDVSSGDNAALVSIVMMNAASDAQADLKGIMATVHPVSHHSKTK